MVFTVWGKIRSGPERGEWAMMLAFDNLELARNVAKQYLHRVLDEMLLIKDDDDIIEVMKEN